MFLRLVNPENWKRAIALVILWAYAYQLVAWPLLFWLTLLASKIIGTDIPVPPIVPWEQLATGTATLGTVGGIQAWREKASGNVQRTTGQDAGAA